MLLAARGRFPNFGPYQDPVPLAIGHIRERMGTRLTEVALSEGKWDWPASPFPQRNELRPNNDPSVLIASRESSQPAPSC
jgi:hypothetical protein